MAFEKLHIPGLSDDETATLNLCAEELDKKTPRNVLRSSHYDGILDGSVMHTDQPQVNVALSLARKRPLAGGWAWNRKDAASDITPVVAETLALWGAQNDNVQRPSRRAGSRTAVVL